MWKMYDKEHNIEVSDGGEIRRDGIILSQNSFGKGYKGVFFNGKNHYVHRLVAECFCEKPSGSEIIDHIDGNKKNNNANNLRWVNYSENLKYAFEQGLRPRTNKALLEHRKRTSKRVAQYLNGIKIAEYESIAQASRENGLFQSNVSRAVNGKSRTSGGYEWRIV